MYLQNFDQHSTVTLGAMLPWAKQSLNLNWFHLVTENFELYGFSSLILDLSKQCYIFKSIMLIWKILSFNSMNHHWYLIFNTQVVVLFRQLLLILILVIVISEQKWLSNFYFHKIEHFYEFSFDCYFRGLQNEIDFSSYVTKNVLPVEVWLIL